MNSRWALVLLCALACTRAAAEMLQFSGECRYSLVDQEGKLEHRTARTFTAPFDGCRWRIRTAQFGTKRATLGKFSLCLHGGGEWRGQSFRHETLGSNEASTGGWAAHRKVS